jgi:cysteine synthase
MPTLGLEDHIVDQGAYDRTVAHLRDAGVRLPTFAELAHPATIPPAVRQSLLAVGPDDPHPLNLWRAHWYNDAYRTATAGAPGYVVLGPELTGSPARIVVALGDRFPLIGAHKVLAAYACLAPRLVTGQFDPTVHRAVWPSTGNYCRGGVAISRLLGCRGVAVLPQGMSRERFAWLENWVNDPSDIIATPGSESNVKEIYDRCAELSQDPANVIFNQFSEFSNYLAHYECTGLALADVFEHLRNHNPRLRLQAFVSASGSSGTLGAGDRLKEAFGARIVAVEALECPTMLYNGFGEHNIQGIGDKHIPFVHNVHNTDIVTAVSDRATDHLAVLFSSRHGLAYLAEHRKVPAAVLDALGSLGLSGICNVVAAVKTAKYLDLGPDDAIITVATDGAGLYASERAKVQERDFPEGFGPIAAAETFGRWMLGAGTDHLLETTKRDRDRIFNLGYFTWVEQQGVALNDFVARKDQAFWSGLRAKLPLWDEMISELNARSGVTIG